MANIAVGSAGGRARFDRSVCAAALSVVLCMLITGVAARPQEPQKPARPPIAPARTETASIVPTTAHELTGPDLEAFLDGMMPSQLERENIAGATISVVKDGKLIFAK